MYIISSFIPDKLISISLGLPPFGTVIALMTDKTIFWMSHDIATEIEHKLI